MARTAKEALKEVRAQLTPRSGDGARVEAELLLSSVLGIPRVELYIDAQRELTPAEEKQLEAMVAERLTGKPVQYILGLAEFYGLPFRVDPRVLIPRPETEVLVEVMLNFFKEHGLARSPLVIVDLGTGAGNMAITLAKLLPQARLYATDISSEALEVARKNAEENQVKEQLIFLAGDLFEPLQDLNLGGKVDAFVSNPPYVREIEWPILPAEVREFEPKAALYSPGSGTFFHKRIIQKAPEYLKSGGGVFLEVAAGQTEEVKHFFQKTPGYRDIRVLKDLGGIDRVVWARRLTD